MAITATKEYLTVVGDKIMGCYKLEGDGSTVEWSAPLAAIDSAWFQRGTDTATDEKMTWSGATVTFSTAIANGTYAYVNFIGY
jgi:hypothetical protein